MVLVVYFRELVLSATGLILVYIKCDDLWLSVFTYVLLLVWIVNYVGLCMCVLCCFPVHFSNRPAQVISISVWYVVLFICHLFLAYYTANLIYLQWNVYAYLLLFASSMPKMFLNLYISSYHDCISCVLLLQHWTICKYAYLLLLLHAWILS